MRLVLYISLAALLGTCSPQPPILDQVLDLGELRVVTRDSPTAYVDSPDGPSGPEYDLAKAFADHLGAMPRHAPMVIWNDPQTLDWERDDLALQTDAARHLVLYARLNDSGSTVATTPLNIDAGDPVG